VKPAVANMSLGSDVVDPAVDTAVNNAVASGVTFAVAAGNGGEDGIGDDACTTSPAHATGAIAVGATNEADFRTAFSNYGPCVAVFAPGDKITSANLASDTTPLTANRTANALWEEFDQVDAGNGFVALRSLANGRFVTAEAGGAAPLVASRTSVGGWEKFRVLDNPDGTISLLANANGKLVT